MLLRFTVHLCKFLLVTWNDGDGTRLRNMGAAAELTRLCFVVNYTQLFRRRYLVKRTISCSNQVVSCYADQDDNNNNYAGYRFACFSDDNSPKSISHPHSAHQSKLQDIWLLMRPPLLLLPLLGIKPNKFHHLLIAHTLLLSGFV